MHSATGYPSQSNVSHSSVYATGQLKFIWQVRIKVTFKSKNRSILYNWPLDLGVHAAVAIIASTEVCAYMEFCGNHRISLCFLLNCVDLTDVDWDTAFLFPGVSI